MEDMRRPRSSHKAALEAVLDGAAMLVARVGLLTTAHTASNMRHNNRACHLDSRKALQDTSYPTGRKLFDLRL